MISFHINTFFCVVAFALVIFVDFDSNQESRRKLRSQQQQQQKHAIPAPYVMNDGTVMVGRRSQIRACDYWMARPPHFPKRLTPRPITAIHYHFEDCAEHQLGNRLGEHYQRYLLASAARVPYKMTCGDQNDNSTLQRINLNRIGILGESVLRHLQGQHSVPPIPKFGNKVWTIHDVCQNCGGAGWDSKDGPQVLMDIFRQDMWKLAYNTTVGQSVAPDDAIIHLRLGDALKGANDQRIGLLPHQAYIDVLQRAKQERGEIKTIGLVTQPFERNLARAFDRMQATLEKSKAVALDLQGALQRAFPGASVVIYNDEEEIPLKSFARLIKAAKVSVCGSSTFCTYPVLSTRNGLGFVYHTERHSPWAVKLEGVLPHVRTFKVPRLSNNYTAILDVPQILHWLNHQNVHGPDMVIDRPPLIRNNNTQTLSVVSSNSSFGADNDDVTLAVARRNLGQSANGLAER